MGRCYARLPLEPCRWAADSLPALEEGVGKVPQDVGVSAPAPETHARGLALLGEWVALVEIPSCCHFLPDGVQPKKGPEKAEGNFHLLNP